jgi:hypothetical protein
MLIAAALLALARVWVLVRRRNAERRAAAPAAVPRE